MSTRQIDLNGKENRFWEKYAVLERLNQKYANKHVSSIDQTIQLMSEGCQIWRLHPSHKKAVAEDLRMKIQRQKTFYRIAQKKHD